MTHLDLIRIRQVARAGDTMRAWHMLEVAGLLESDEADVLTLKGRLLKDRASRSEGGKRSELFEQAEAAYMRAAGDRRATYPLINAATIALLNGKIDRANSLAQQTIALLDSGDHEPETRYWLGATRAEAQLLLGNIPACKAAIEQAIAETPAAWEDQASTIRQLKLILGHLSQPDAIFDHLRPPPSLYFSGLICLNPDQMSVRNAIDGALGQIGPGCVFGALAAGADILVAEAAVARGARLHVILPAPIDIFRRVSVEQFGAGWTDRFDALVEQAEAIDIVADGNQLSDAAINLAEEVAMGLAIRHANSLATEAIALRVRRVDDPQHASEIAWRAFGLPIQELIVEGATALVSEPLALAKTRAILASARAFPSDLLRPLQIAPRFVDGFWYLVFDDLPDAAELAVAIFHAMPDARLGLEYRVLGVDGDVGKADVTIAAYLSRTAPEGHICASRPAALALHLRAPDLHFEAAGEIITPFGDLPIHLLSRGISQ